MDGECRILGRVVWPGPDGVPQSTLLGILLPLLLLVAALATALVFSYWWQRKQLGEFSAPTFIQPLPPINGIFKSLHPLSAQDLGI